MDYLVLNDRETKVSRLSMGTWAFSNDPLWGTCDQKSAYDTVNAALDCGVNLIDTAERYGNGQAEIVLGNALKERRNEAVLATKVYSDHLYHDGIVNAVDQSLLRLQTDYIDIIQLHWPNESIPLEETYGTFEELKQAGKIRMVSVCNHGIQCMEHASKYPIVLNQMPYSLVWRLAEYQLSACMEEKQIPLWAYSPLGQGLLTGKFKTLEDVPVNRRKNRMYDCKWNPGRHTDHGYEKEIFGFLDQLRGVCQETGYTMSSLAFGFLKSKSYIGSILVGARDRKQLMENVTAYETEISQDVIDQIDRLSLELRNHMGENADLWENGLNKLGKEGRIY